MLVIPGRAGKDTCDGVTRRELLRVGGSSMLGLSLAEMFRHQQSAQRCRSRPSVVDPAGARPRA